MLERTDFEKKQVVFVFSYQKEKISFRNDNLIVTDADKKVKYQTTCYRIFAVFVIGEATITTGLISRAQKFGFVIYLMNRSFKLYSVIGNRMEGNTLLHRKQYTYDKSGLAQWLVGNKIHNQRETLNLIRRKSEACKDAISILDQYADRLDNEELTIESLLGVEGSASRVYFPQVFNNTCWNGRKPRLKSDRLNSTLDMGYNILFNMVDSLLQLYGFDVYCGVYHREFYMRKSLVCDIMEPMRTLIDYEIRKAINLKQIQDDDFQVINNQYVVNYKNSPKYVELFMNVLLDNKEEMFLFVQGYYRSFMKGKPEKEYRRFGVVRK